MIHSLPVLHGTWHCIQDEADLLLSEVKLSQLAPDSLFVHYASHDGIRFGGVFQVLVIGESEQNLADHLFGKMLHFGKLVGTRLKRRRRNSLEFDFYLLLDMYIRYL
jgi:hypothetical protein